MASFCLSVDKSRDIVKTIFWLCTVIIDYFEIIEYLVSYASHFEGSFQGFQKYIFHRNQAILPEMILFFRFCGQNDQFRPRISDMVM